MAGMSKRASPVAEEKALAQQERERAARAQLEAQLRALDEVEASNAEDRRTVELDQQSVGRLSRMDALQRQAMAQETERRRAMERRRIASALERLDEGEYGYCLTCGEEIAPKRLELDPMAATCVGCAQ